ncbi:hypothetical protein [Paenibacillus polymyxa]|uniref:hypothetical protein n=1 Tax=Paenibacillus polymyxa TaxID=1406 RepID=UPI0006C22D9B|nr:hypothetical protein [Paenibacillus polymyxa]KOS03958.1 hypothetical protein AM598_03665 [Paenibacillus polymyxa]
MNNRWRQLRKIMTEDDFFWSGLENQPEAPCPVCGGKLIYDSWFEECFGCTESVTKCTGCNYLDSWSYGHTHLEVGEWSTDFFYSTPDEEVERIRSEFIRLMIFEKQRRKREIRKYYRKRG